MRKIIFVLSCVSALLLTACAPFGSGQAVTWESIPIQKCSITLISDSQMEYYDFGENGWVVVTFGERDGLVTASIERFTVQGRELVIDRMTTLKNPHINGNILTAQNEHFIWKRFVITKHP